MTEQPFLVVDSGVFDVAVELGPVARVDDRHRHRCEPLTVILVGVGHDQVGVAAGVGLGQALAQHRLAVTNEHPHLETAGLGAARQIGQIAPAIRRPVLGDDRALRRPAGLRGQPGLPRGLVVGDPCPRVALAEVAAPVDPRTGQAEAAHVESLAGQVLGRPDVREVVVEAQAPGETLRGHAVAALRSSSCLRAPAIIDARSDVSITMSKPRFTAPAAKPALAQCMTALMPCLCAASRILSQVAMCTGSGLSPRGAIPSANERSDGPMYTASSPFVAQIASRLARPSLVSIIAITTISSLALAR